MSSSTLRNRPTNNTTRKTVTATAIPNVTLKTPTKPLVLDDYLAAVPPESNTYLRQKEKLEHDSAKQLPREAQNLFPTLDDPEFNTKLVQHPEFHVAGELDPVAAAAVPKSVEEESNKVCASRDEDEDDDRFLEHQLFVRNFLAPTSPYNSLLLYHSATANKWCAAIGVAEEWRRLHHSGGGGATTTIFTTTKEDADSFQKTLFQPSMLEQIGDRVVAKWGCATEGLLRDVNPTNAAVPMAQLVQDIQQLIAKTYHIKEDLSWGDPSPTSSSSFVIIDNIIPTPKLTEMLLSNTDGKKQRKILLLYSFPMLEKPQEIVELVNLMNANDGRGLIEANEVFDPRRSNKFVEAHKENGHFVQESGEDLLRRKLNGYVSFLRSETPYTHALRLYPDVFAPDRVFRESTSLWQTLGKLVSSLSMQPVTKPVEYPTQQIHGEPFAVDASGGSYSQRLRHLPLYLTHLGEEQERIYEEMLKNTKPGVSMTPLLEALTMTYPKPAMGTSSATFDSLMMETNGSYEYRFPADRIFAPDRLPKYSGKLAEICRILGTVKAAGNRVLIVSFSNMVPLALALEEYGFIRVGGDALLRQPGTTTTPQKKMLSSYSLGFSTEADIVLLTADSDATTKHRNIRQIHFLDPPPHMNRLEQIIATAIYPRSHCGLPFSKRNVEIYMHASVSNASPREQADVFAYRTVYESARAIGRVTRLMKEVAVDSLFAPRDYSMSQFENNKIKIQLPTQDSVMEFVAGDRPYSAVCDYMEKCALPQWASAPRRATLQALLLEQPPIESRVTQRIRQLFQEKTIYKRTDLLAAVQRPRMFSLEKVVKELSRLISEKSDVMYDQYGRRGYLVLRGDIYAFQPVEITDTHSGEFERTVPVEVKPVSTVVGGGNVDGKKKRKIFSEIIQDVQLKVDVATGDSNVKIARQPWYEHVQDWFNELQLVHHMTASEIRDYVVDHAIDVMSEDEQRVLLTTLYQVAGQKTMSSKTEKRIRASIDRRLATTGDDAATNVRLGPRTFQQDPENGTWIVVPNEKSRMAAVLDDNGHVRFLNLARSKQVPVLLNLARSKQVPLLHKLHTKTLDNMRKSDLFHLLEQSSLHLPIDLVRNRNASVKHVVVWVEMLLRHKKQM